MTVSTEVDHNDYIGNGVTTSFPYTFRIFKMSDLVVQVADLNENITELVLDTDYTVTGAGGYTGGNVILSTPLTSGYQISISRELPVTQEIDFRNQGKFFAEVHEDGFDKLTMLIQQVRSWFSLALRKPSFVANYYDALNNYIRNLKDPRDPQDAATKNYVDTVSGSNFSRTLRTPENIPQLPSASTRANKIVGFDSSGNPIMLVPESGSASDVLLLLAGPNGYTYIPSIQIQQWRDEGDVRGWGCKCDGVTDDTLNVQQAINERSGVGPVIIPLPTVCSHLTVYSDTILKGKGREISKLIMKAGSNNDFIVGGSADNSTGAHRVRIENIWVYCQDGSNQSGSGITIYGKETNFESIRVTGFPDNNIHTNWTATDTGVSGMEGFFDDIIAEKSGMHNWLFEGPHDSNCSRIILIDASQKTEATYDGLSCRGGSGNARWTGVHAWTNYGNKRMRCALYCDRSAAGNEFELSHFEGAQFANVYILANYITIGASCKIYYPWGGVNVIIAGSAIKIFASIAEEYKGIGLPLSKGIVFAGDYGGPSGCEINCTMFGQDAGSIDFGTSGGYNNVIVRGYNGFTGDTPYLGTPSDYDEVNILISGTKPFILKKSTRMVNNPVYSATTAGSTQDTANGISQTASTIYVSTSPGPLSGILLPSATTVGNGFEVTVSNVNSSGHSIKVYPQPGHQFIGIGVDNPITLAYGKSAQFRVVDGNAGKWIVLQGA